MRPTLIARRQARLPATGRVTWAAEADSANVASCAAHDPSESKIAIGAIDAGRVHIHGARIQREQYAHAVARELAELVELFHKAKAGGQVGHQRVLRVFDIDGGLLGPGMPVEIAADQVAVIRP